MTIRIDFPFAATFEWRDPGNNSRELRTIELQNFLLNSGMELGGAVESFEVINFNGEDNGEFWQVKTAN